MLYISSDHGGYDLKTIIIDFLKENDVDVIDLGPSSYMDGDDYPDYVVPMILKVLENPSNKGIVLCRNGVGVDILANKFNGIRCALSFEPRHAASSRLDDDSNVLSIPADYISEEKAKEMVDAWLNTEFSNEERHKRRLKKVAQLEKL